MMVVAGIITLTLREVNGVKTSFLVTQSKIFLYLCALPHTLQRGGQDRKTEVPQCLPRAPPQWPKDPPPQSYTIAQSCHPGDQVFNPNGLLGDTLNNKPQVHDAKPWHSPSTMCWLDEAEFIVYCGKGNHLLLEALVVFYTLFTARSEFIKN